MDKLSKGLYEFGPFRLDGESRLLFRERESVPLKPKVFDTLLALVEQGGQVLTKQELMERIWPDTAVEENNLTQNISILRKVLGQSPDGRPYIETIPRRGYRFAQPVQEVWEEQTNVIVEKRTRSRIVIEETEDDSHAYQKETANFATQGITDIVPSVSPARRSRRFIKQPVLTILLVLIGLFASAAGWMFILGPKKIIDPELIPNLRMTHLVEWKPAPRQAGGRNETFSRDGKMIAFSSKRAEQNGIWIKQIESGSPIQIVKDEWENESPIWSPDNQHIAYVSNRGNQFGIWMVPALGGPAKQIKELGTEWPTLIYWSKDGATIYYESNANLFSFDLNSKRTNQRTKFNSYNPYSSYFNISPEEDRVVYVDGKEGNRNIWVMPLEGGDEAQITDDKVQITDDAEEDRRPLWHPDGKSIIYSSNRAGIYQICVAYLDRSKPAQITFGDVNRLVSDISSDGTKILCYESKEQSDIFKVNTDTGEEAQIVSDFGLRMWPDVSPDKKTVAIQQTVDKTRIFKSSIVARTGEPESQPVLLTDDGFQPRWSPDGSKIAYLRYADGLFDIWTVKANGGDEKRLTTGGVTFGGFSGLPYNLFQTRDFSWSPDGSKIAYCSKKSGQPGLWVTSTDGSGETALTEDTEPDFYFYCPLWSPDGNRIAYISIPTNPDADGRSLKTVRIAEQGKSRIVYESYSRLRLIGWSENGDNLIVGWLDGQTNYNPASAQINLTEVSINPDRNRDIGAISPAYFANIHLSPDRRFIAFASRKDERDAIWVISTSGGAARKVSRNEDKAIYVSSLMWSPNGKEIFYCKQSSWSLISIVDNFRGK